MPLFGSASPFDADVEKATNEMNTSEDWNLYLDICDRAKQSTPQAKDCLKSIQKRLHNRVPHVAMQALALLNACVKNCGEILLREIASRDFVEDCKTLVGDKAHPKVAQKLKLMIKSWSENEFKSDSSLRLIPDFYNSLKAEGHIFQSDEIPKSTTVLSKDPNVVSSQEEEDDIAKAIALSLKDESKKSSPKTSQLGSSTLYPTVSSGGGAYTSPPNKHKEPVKVRALYDFEAAEDNELTFKAGEIIGVIDDSDPNWWKGVSWRGEGLFPANFVTSDLEAPTELEEERLTEKKAVNIEPQTVVIDEEKIDEALALIQNADPTGEACPDPPNLAALEEECRLMAPLIDQELEKTDKQHIRLMGINTELMNAMQMYHSLMTESSSTLYASYAPTSVHPAAVHTSLNQMMSGQQGLSVAQIPQGISAQVGPAGAPQHLHHPQPGSMPPGTSFGPQLATTQGQFAQQQQYAEQTGQYTQYPNQSNPAAYGQYVPAQNNIPTANQQPSAGAPYTNQQPSASASYTNQQPLYTSH